MAENNNPNPTTDKETDISKAQSQQQPPEQAKQQPETGEAQGQFEAGQSQQFETGEASSEGLESETATKQRSDIEGASQQDLERGEAESGFVGTKGDQDTSSELVENEDDEKTKGDGE